MEDNKEKAPSDVEDHKEPDDAKIDITLAILIVKAVQKAIHDTVPKDLK